VFGAALVLSMIGLAHALRTIPVGTGYAIWVGIGAVGTAVYGMAALSEPLIRPPEAPTSTAGNGSARGWASWPGGAS
jgi:hypothetical protein